MNISSDSSEKNTPLKIFAAHALSVREKIENFFITLIALEVIFP